MLWIFSLSSPGRRRLDVSLERQQAVYAVVVIAGSTEHGTVDIRCIETAEELSSELEGSFVHDPRRCSLGWLLRHQSYTTR